MNARAMVSPAQDSSAIDAWRPALIAYYQADCCFMRAETLRNGWRELDTTDLRMIEALKAALAVAP